jgi:glycosyltransferase involved in cell wall biosynthesis
MEPLEVFVATHVTEIYGPVQALRHALSRDRRDFAFAACPFAYAKLPAASVVFHLRGQGVGQEIGHFNQGEGPGRWLRDAVFIWRQAWRYANRRTMYIGINALNAAVGIWLRRFGRVRSVVYYVIDYTPRRFASGALNWLYQRVCRFAARNADAVWNLSERMRVVHAGFGTRPKRNLLVPVGVQADAVRLVPEREMARRRLVVVSALFESKGVQLAIDALRQLPDAQLAVVGTGPYEEALRARAQEQGVADRVEFLGLMDHDRLFRYLPTCGVALAPYRPDADSYTYYADPTKPKEYLACGLPVVITRVPWVAELIARGPMGLAIEYDEEQLAAACRRLLTDDAFWRTCRENALAYARSLDWTRIFAQALKESGFTSPGRTPIMGSSER